MGCEDRGPRSFSFRPLRAFAMAMAMAMAMTCAAVTAHAAEGDGERVAEPAAAYFEITPFVAYRMGGDFDVAGSEGNADLNDHGSFGIALDLQADPESSSQYELLYSRQQSELARTSPLGPLSLNVEYLHIGGTLVVGDELRGFTPYIAGGLGVTRFNPDSQIADDDTRFSLSLGAGVRVPVTGNFGLRLEARGYLTFINTDSAVFCASGSFGGVCSIRARGDTFIQYELLAGASFSF